MKLSGLKAHRRELFPDKSPLFYYITDSRQLKGPSILRCVRRALDWGADFVQIREKELSERGLYELTCRVVSLARDTKCRVLVNGRADVALAAGADGVHLPSTGLRISDIRSWIPKDFLVGVSVHSLREIRDAEAQKADYILIGHVFPTKSKEGYGPSLGLDFLSKACKSTSVPIFGLGGMNPERIDPVIKAGAVGVAGISLFQNPVEFAQLRKISTLVSSQQVRSWEPR
jgi:thiamine-phosphate pyrophosphorylase